MLPDPEPALALGEWGTVHRRLVDLVCRHRFSKGESHLGHQPSRIFKYRRVTVEGARRAGCISKTWPISIPCQRSPH